MENLMVFNNDEFGEIRVVKNDGTEWFVAKDICNILELGNTSQALSRLDDDEKDIILNDTLGGEQKTLVITESGLYGLTLSSRKPQAKPFQRWVRKDVLPNIRKHGMYVKGEEKVRSKKELKELIDNAVERRIGIEARKTFTDRIKETLNPNDGLLYAVITNEFVYKPAFGKTCAQLKNELGLSKKDNLRDYMSPTELVTVKKYEDMARMVLESSDGYEEAKSKMEQMLILLK